MNTFETNASGNSVALVTAGVASLLGTMAATISPREENAATPKTKLRTAATAVRPNISSPNKSTPATSMIATDKIAIHVDEQTRPAMYIHGGNGVPRTRFKMPSSRASTVAIARLT